MAGVDIEQRVAQFLGDPQIVCGLSALGKRLPPEAAVYLVGGAIRNLAIEAIHGCRPEIRDLDIFVNRVPADAILSERFPRHEIEVTDLGGICWRPAGFPFDFDLCLMKDFVVLDKLKLSPTVENLLSTIDFTMNALVYDLKNRRLHRRNALAHIRRRLIDFNTRVFYTPLAICYRALLLRHKTGFVFSEAVYRFLREEASLETLTETKKLLRTRHGKALSRSIMEDYDRVSTSHGYEDYIAEAGG